jgi:hypothetical protein
LQEGTWNIACGYIAILVSKDSSLNKNGLSHDCWGISFLLGNVLLLDTAIGTGARFQFTSAFFCEEHKRQKGIAVVVMGEGVGVAWAKTIHGV